MDPRASSPLLQQALCYSVTVPTLFQFRPHHRCRRRDKHVTEAIKQLQNSELDGHVLTLKVSQNTRAAATKHSKAKVPKSTKIIVRNVAFEASKKDIKDLFAAFGQIKSVRMPVKKFDGSHRGFAFVDFLTQKEAQHVMDAVSGSTHLYGRRLVLEWAKVRAVLFPPLGRTALPQEGVGACCPTHLVISVCGLLAGPAGRRVSG